VHGAFARSVSGRKNAEVFCQNNEFCMFNGMGCCHENRRLDNDRPGARSKNKPQMVKKLTFFIDGKSRFLVT
jgi:hypothetical protein